jgi:hypothetical protein
MATLKINLRKSGGLTERSKRILKAKTRSGYGLETLKKRLKAAGKSKKKRAAAVQSAEWGKVAMKHIQAMKSKGLL